ncbi:MAG: UrcA family protein [Phenylobacterium sp.]|jgi:UrcA family protein|nr:UrcA family protein [Phenylobacterium sp.]
MRNLLIAAGVAALAAAAAAPAFAQSVEELTVTGQWNGRGEPPASLSRVVSFNDLDLRNTADQTELRRRITTTARDICDELGQERPGAGNLGRSCQERAVDDAMRQVRGAVAQAYSAPPVYAAVGAGADTAYVAPIGPTVSSSATSVDTAAAPASYTVETITNGPVADTPANRAKFGGPMSNAGKRTAARGN